jgi:hypothetical protein
MGGLDRNGKRGSGDFSA